MNQRNGSDGDLRASQTRPRIRDIIIDWLDEEGLSSEQAAEYIQIPHHTFLAILNGRFVNEQIRLHLSQYIPGVVS